MLESVNLTFGRELNASNFLVTTASSPVAHDRTFWRYFSGELRQSQRPRRRKREMMAKKCPKKKSNARAKLLFCLSNSSCWQMPITCTRPSRVVRVPPGPRFYCLCSMFSHEKAVGEAVDLIVTILYSLSRMVLVSTCTEPGRMRQVVVCKRVKGLWVEKFWCFE